MSARIPSRHRQRPPRHAPGRRTNTRYWATGLALVLAGLVMVLIAIPLGG